MGRLPSDAAHLHSVIILDSIRAVSLPELITIPSELHVHVGVSEV